MNNRSLLKQLQRLLMPKAKKKSPYLALAVTIAFSLGYYFLNQYESSRPTKGHASPSYEQVDKPTIKKNTDKSSDATSLLKLKWDGSMSDIAVPVNGNKSNFTANDLKSKEDYWTIFSKRDSLGRALEANAKLSPTIYREVKQISRPRIPAGNDPVGWKYDGHSNNRNISFEGEKTALYNRSHLIAWRFIADAGSMENLVTGTRAFNTPGMTEYEQKVADILYYKNYHVRYRVTPIYKGSELLPRGMQMMAKSIEDNGKSLDYNVYVFNVQPGVILDYATGQNSDEK
jgi:hypothetical protein